jgi:hypothetical protein
MMAPLAPLSDTQDLAAHVVPDILLAAGFRWGSKGTHTSRTIMVRELSLLLAACPKDAAREEYVAAIKGGNCLRKSTVATRRLSAQRLGELYGLDPGVPLFRVMRTLWYADQNGHPLLAVLLALARSLSGYVSYWLPEMHSSFLEWPIVLLVSMRRAYAASPREKLWEAAVRIQDTSTTHTLPPEPSTPPPRRMRGDEASGRCASGL